MMVLTEAQAFGSLSFELAFRAVRESLIAAANGGGSVNPVLVAQGLNDGEIFGVKSGKSSIGRLVGLKVGSYWPGNEARGIACHGSTILLLDPDTGRLMAVLEANTLNGPRTAAADAIAANALAREDSRTLTVIGAGHQAAYEVQALCAIRQIRRVLVASRSSARAAALCQVLSAKIDVEIAAVGIEEGCREADILVTVTTSTEPLFESAWLKQGVHISAMGADRVGKQELPLDVLRRARLFCDLPSQSIAIGEFQHIKSEVEAGVIVLTAIGNVLSGCAPGRQSSEETTVFDSSGLALQDLYIASHLLAEHKRAGDRT
jgi:ornithine cyclodeaminase